jgi:CRISPR-associated protein Cas1
MQWEDDLYGTIKNGVLTLNGFVSNVTVEHGSLLVRDGVKGAVVERKFSRASCPISRIISLGSEGYISFGAVRWLHDIGASVVHLNYDGTPLLATVPAPNDPVSLRRLQAAVTADTPLGSSIARSLIGSKIKGQIEVLKELGYRDQAAEAADYATQINPATNMSDLLGIEGTVAKIYWRSTADMPVQFGPRQPIPDHWKTFGSRHSTLTGAPRAAVTPGNAMLNYLYGVLASEITIALHAIGLDPAFGTLHADKDDRASLAYDLMEPARPLLDRWFFHWLQSATFSKRDFFEDYRGQIRLMRPLNSHLAMTAALWREIADQLAQWFYKRLSGNNASLRLKFVDLEIEAGRRAKRWALGNALQRPVTYNLHGVRESASQQAPKVLLRCMCKIVSRWGAGLCAICKSSASAIGNAAASTR